MTTVYEPITNVPDGKKRWWKKLPALETNFFGQTVYEWFRDNPFLESIVTRYDAEFGMFVTDAIFNRYGVVETVKKVRMVKYPELDIWQQLLRDQAVGISRTDASANEGQKPAVDALLREGWYHREDVNVFGAPTSVKAPFNAIKAFNQLMEVKCGFPLSRVLEVRDSGSLEDFPKQILLLESVAGSTIGEEAMLNFASYIAGLSDSFPFERTIYRKEVVSAAYNGYMAVVDGRRKYVENEFKELVGRLVTPESTGERANGRLRIELLAPPKLDIASDYTVRFEPLGSENLIVPIFTTRDEIEYRGLPVSLGGELSPWVHQPIARLMWFTKIAVSNTVGSSVAEVKIFFPKLQ